MSIDHQHWAERLAKALDDFIWLHSGGDGRDLNVIYRDALNLMSQYRQECGSPIELVQPRVPLKTLIELAAKQAVLEDRDQYQAILEIVAERSRDVERFIRGDTRIYEDIKEWLEYEASLEIT